MNEVDTDLIDTEKEEFYDIWLPFRYGFDSEPI